MRLVEQLLTEAIQRFNKKVDEDKKLEEELSGFRKIVQVEVEDGQWYHFILENAHVQQLNKGGVDSPDIRVIASAETLTKLWSGELRVMKAYATRKIQIKGSIEDLLRLRKFF